MFKIGDKVVYNPSMKNLPIPDERPWDIGIVIGLTTSYIIIKTNSNTLKVLKDYVDPYYKKKCVVPYKTKKYIYISEDYSDSESLFY